MHRKDRLLNGNGKTLIKIKWDLISDSILGYNVYFSNDGSSYNYVPNPLEKVTLKRKKEAIVGDYGNFFYLFDFFKKCYKIF